MSRLVNSTLTDVTVRRQSDPNSSIIERPVLFTVSSSSTSCQGCGASNLELAGKNRYWNTTAQTGWVLLELNQKALLSALVIHNRSVSSVDIEMAVENTKHGFVRIKAGMPLPHNRQTAVRCGQLPCRFIRIRCYNKGNTPVALNALEVQGLPTHDIKAAIGQSFKRLLGSRPERLIFGPSLEASLPHKDFDARNGGYGGAEGKAGEWSRARAERRQGRYAELALRALGRGGLDSGGSGPGGW